LKQLFTVQQLEERDMFVKRKKAGLPIGAHEFDYPILQGYDSVALDTDAEMGGTDQTFNMLVGRTMMKLLKHKEKFVITTTLLTHPKTGKKLMNKSEGGLINLDNSPKDIFGKVMALDDVSMFAVAEHCTEMPMERVEALKKKVRGRMNPRDAKLEIAHAVVSIVYGEKQANAARGNFVKLFSKKEIAASDLQILETPLPASVSSLVFRSPVIKSHSDGWRQIRDGAVSINGIVKKNPHENLDLKGGEVVKIGKHHFFRIKIKD
jgi:tyrosyl-tRNA synthetase